MEQTRAAGKAVIIRDSGKILVMKRSEDETHLQGLWDVPGGRFDYKEEPHKALKREVKEESGIEIKIVEPVRVWDFLRDNGEHIIGTTFLCTPESLDVEIGDEHTHYKWIEFNRLDDISMHDDLREGLKTAWKTWDQN